MAAKISSSGPMADFIVLMAEVTTLRDLVIWRVFLRSCAVALFISTRICAVSARRSITKVPMVFLPAAMSAPPWAIYVGAPCAPLNRA